MSCSLTYDSNLGRIRVDATTLCVSGTASYATVERSPDGSSYTTIRGGTDVVVVTGCAFGYPVDDYEFPPGQLLTYRIRAYSAADALVAEYTCEITVDLDTIWLKSVERPFLNREINCVGNPSPVKREARGGVFQILGRSFPVATTDARGGVNVSLRFATTTYAELVALDYLLASGDIMYVQTPPTFPIESMFAVIVNAASVLRPLLNRTCDNDIRWITLPLREVAPVDESVVGSTATWKTVVLTYATWSDVIADNATWADLLELVADPSEVIVP